jgi:hypothetical protein
MTHDERLEWFRRWFEAETGDRLRERDLLVIRYWLTWRQQDAQRRRKIRERRKALLGTTDTQVD